MISVQFNVQCFNKVSPRFNYESLDVQYTERDDVAHI